MVLLIQKCEGKMQSAEFKLTHLLREYDQYFSLHSDKHSDYAKTVYKLILRLSKIKEPNWMNKLENFDFTNYY